MVYNDNLKKRHQKWIETSDLDTGSGRCGHSDFRSVQVMAAVDPYPWFEFQDNSSKDDETAAILRNRFLPLPANISAL